MQTRVTRVVYPRAETVEYVDWLTAISTYKPVLWPALAQLADCSQPIDRWVLYASRDR